MQGFFPIQSGLSRSIFDDPFFATFHGLNHEGNIKNSTQLVFQPEELLNRNCTGTAGKEALDQVKLGVVKSYVFKLYPCATSHEFVCYQIYPCYFVIYNRRSLASDVLTANKPVDWRLFFSFVMVATGAAAFWVLCCSRYLHHGLDHETRQKRVIDYRTRQT